MATTFAEMGIEGDVVHVGAQPLSPDLMRQYAQSDGILVGWGILTPVVELCRFNASEWDWLCSMLEQGRLFDLKLAAYLYSSAAGESSDLSLASYGGSVLDAVWLLGKLDRGVLVRMHCGKAALAASAMAGLPVDMDEVEAAKGEMVRTGNMLADLLQADCAGIWEQSRDVPVVDRFGLPTMVDSVARVEAIRRVAHSHMILLDSRSRLNDIAQMYPGIEFVQRLVRFRRLKRDLHKMDSLTRHGHLQCERVLVDNHLQTRYVGPNLEEAGVRRMVRGEKQMWLVDFSETAFLVAKRFMAKADAGRTRLFQDCEGLSDVGRIATGGRRMTAAAYRKVGMLLLRGVVLDESAEASGLRVYGYRRGGNVSKRVQHYRRNVLRHYGLEKLSDPWRRSLAESLDANLGLGWRESIICPMGSQPEHVVHSVVMLGNDPLCGWPDEVISSVWEMLSSYCRDAEVMDAVSARRHGGRLLHSLFNHEAVTPDGKRLSRCDRAGAGLWSVFGGVHDCIRQFMWLMLRRHGAVTLGVAGFEALVEPATPVCADAVADAAGFAQIDCCGAAAPVVVSATRRWR